MAADAAAERFFTEIDLSLTAHEEIGVPISIRRAKPRSGLASNLN